MTDVYEYCPVHGDPTDLLRNWACPMALDGDPPDKQNCTYFEAELKRRTGEIAAGNYYELTPYDEHGNRWFVGHGRHAGERRVAWSRDQATSEGLSS